MQCYRVAQAHPVLRSVGKEYQPWGMKGTRAPPSRQSSGLKTHFSGSLSNFSLTLSRCGRFGGPQRQATALPVLALLALGSY